ncbi:MAG: hypothetical protein IPJ68_05960 [Candidatus Moraniibacteriota bacterium]|nr:MAG: hypothetical protein IPJ68_05960 [Candidatus Moranbacteria bacterium]
MIDLIKESPSWMYSGMFAILAIGFFLWWRSMPDSYEPPVVYTAKNVEVNGVYHIDDGRSNTQTFEVHAKKGRQFLVEVYPQPHEGSPYLNEPYLFGWLTHAPSDRFIRKEDFIAAPGDESRRLITT